MTARLRWSQGRVSIFSLKDEPGGGSEAIRSPGLLSCLSVNVFSLLGADQREACSAGSGDGFDFAFRPFSSSQLAAPPEITTVDIDATKAASPSMDDIRTCRASHEMVRVERNQAWN